MKEGVMSKKGGHHHPALQQQTLVDRIRESDQEDVESLDGWEVFSPLKKHILQLMPYFADALAAYRYIKPSKTPDDPHVQNDQWQALVKLKSRDRRFAAAIDQRKDRRIDLPAEFSANMMGKSVFLMDSWLDDPEVSITDKLKIIRMVQEIQSPTYQSEGNTMDMTAHYGNITINFAKEVEAAAQTIKEKIHPRPIEAIVVPEEDDEEQMTPTYMPEEEENE
jgi:hypothetical protein